MNYYTVGKIVNTHGIRGEVKVIATTDFSEERFVIGNKLYLFLPQQSQPLELIIKSHRKHKQFEMLSFDGYDNINLVEKFKQCELKISEEQQASLPEDEYYYHEIIGLNVLDEQQEEIGTIKEILSPGANDVWVVKRKGKKDLLLPAIKDVIKSIDIEKGEVIVEVLEGLDD